MLDITLITDTSDQDRYLGRRAAGKEAADALDRAYRETKKDDPDDGVSAG